MVDYSIFHGCLFKRNILCIPNSSLHIQLIKEVHSGGLVAHVGCNKTIEQLKNHFWPKLQKDVQHLIECHSICQTYKGSAQNSRLYMHLPITG